MRVLIYGFSGKILGGIETFILNMNEHMSSDTVFDYIIDGDTCVYRDRIERRGGRILFVPGVRKHPLGYVSTFRKILKEQKRQGTYILYIQLFSMANMLPAFLGKMLGYKVILHAHNNGLQSKSKIYEYIHLAGKHLSKKVRFVRFTNSQLSSDFMFGKGVDSTLIYNAIDTDKFSFHKEWRSDARQEVNCTDKTVVGFVGRFFSPKNPLFMLRVFAEYKHLNPDSMLWIVGEGDMKDDMLALANELGISNSIYWWGRRNDVNRLMCGMDMLLQPSNFEGLGIVLVEAQATGLPVVTSVDVVPEEAKASDHFYTVSLNDAPKHWAEVCHEALFSNASNNRYAKKIIEEYDINKQALGLEKEIHRTLK